MSRGLGLGLALGLSLAGALVAGLLFGSVRLAPGVVLDAIMARLTGNEPVDLTASTIVWALRMPRVLLALVVGGGLAVVGVGMQALVRNPLAEPYLLGVSSGASAGASLFYLGFLPPVLSTALSLPLAAFFGALFAMVLVVLVAREGNHLPTARLLLAGVALSALFASVTAFVTFASPDADRMRAVLFWLLGSFAGAQWASLWLPLTVALGGSALLWLVARPLDALLTGEDAARALGVPVEGLKWGLIGWSALVTGVLVAAAGVVGFVGLIVPHAVRFVVGVSHRRVVPVAFVAGGAFLILADLAARTVLANRELPVGVLTALCGVPFFLVLLRRSTSGTSAP
ncbi:MAG: iron ABC transporter permease [Bacteroidota bacterium]